MTRPRVAWFSPLPPSVSGIAAYSADILPALREQHAIDVFVDAVPQTQATLNGRLNDHSRRRGDFFPSAVTSTKVEVSPGLARANVFSAHEFVWRHRRQPYDLTAYQLGNAACHDYMWGFMFRYPGLTVLHDAQLHQARALALTRRWQPRLDDYLEEFRANQPDAPADLGYLIAAGLGGTLFPHWPLVRLVTESARMVAVHNAWLADELQARHPRAHVRYLPMGVPEIAPDLQGAHAIRSGLGIPDDAVVFAALGGVTETKRVPLILEVVGAMARQDSRVHLLVIGDTSGFDRERAGTDFGAPQQLHVAGFVADADLPAWLFAADVGLCLRWPSNRETSASWLRCLSAGRCTVTTDLTHNHEVPALDPRTWEPVSLAASPSSADPVTVAIDPLDERHSLTLAAERLRTDRTLRRRLGRAAHAWWQRHHRLEATVAGYLALLDDARSFPAPSIDLPAHLSGEGLRRAHALVQPFGEVATARVAAAVPTE